MTSVHLPDGEILSANLELHGKSDKEYQLAFRIMFYNAQLLLGQLGKRRMRNVLRHRQPDANMIKEIYPEMRHLADYESCESMIAL